MVVSSLLYHSRQTHFSSLLSERYSLCASALPVFPVLRVCPFTYAIILFFVLVPDVLVNLPCWSVHYHRSQACQSPLLCRGVRSASTLVSTSAFGQNLVDTCSADYLFCHTRVCYLVAILPLKLGHVRRPFGRRALHLGSLCAFHNRLDLLLLVGRSQRLGHILGVDRLFLAFVGYSCFLWGHYKYTISYRK